MKKLLCVLSLSLLVIPSTYPIRREAELWIHHTPVDVFVLLSMVVSEPRLFGATQNLIDPHNYQKDDIVGYSRSEDGREFHIYKKDVAAFETAPGNRPCHWITLQAILDAKRQAESQKKFRGIRIPISPEEIITVEDRFLKAIDQEPYFEAHPSLEGDQGYTSPLRRLKSEK